MSVYTIKTDWTPIKEKHGILRNTANCNVEYAITDGALPSSGATLLPDEKVEFTLLPQRPPVRPPFGVPPFYGCHHDYMYHHPHVPMQTLFVRSLGVTDNHTYSVVVDNLEPDNAVNYDIFGLTQWSPNRLYVKDQFVVYEKHLYWCSEEHKSGQTFDLTKFSMICNDLEDITSISDTITVKTCDGTTKTVTVNHVAHAIAATNDEKGNKIDTTYATVAGLTAQNTSLSGDITAESTARATADTAIRTDVDRDYLKKADATSTYLAKTDATSTYLSKADAGSTYLTKADAASSYMPASSAQSGFLTTTDAASTYLAKTDATSTYLAKTDATSNYLTKADAATTYSTKTEASNLSGVSFFTAINDGGYGNESTTTTQVGRIAFSRYSYSDTDSSDEALWIFLYDTAGTLIGKWRVYHDYQTGTS